MCPLPNSPSVLKNIIGSNADILPIPDQDYSSASQSGALNYATGWPPITSLALEAGGKAPRREYFNTVNQLFSQHLYFMQSGSLYPWNASFPYRIGAHVQGSDNKEYVALKNSGPGNGNAVNPVGDKTGTWIALQVKPAVDPGGSGSSGGGSADKAGYLLYVDYGKSSSGDGFSQANAFKNFSDCFAAILKDIAPINNLYNTSTNIPTILIKATAPGASQTIEAMDWYFSGMQLTIEFEKNFALPGKFNVNGCVLDLRGPGKFTVNGLFIARSSSVYFNTNFDMNGNTSNLEFGFRACDVEVASGVSVSVNAFGGLSMSQTALNIFGTLTTHLLGNSINMFVQSDVCVLSGGLLNLTRTAALSPDAFTLDMVNTSIRGQGRANLSSLRMSGGVILFDGSGEISFGANGGSTPSQGIVMNGGIISVERTGTVSLAGAAPANKGQIAFGGIIAPSWPGGGTFTNIAGFPTPYVQR